MKQKEFVIREFLDRIAESEENPVDTITVDVPLFIRLLEYAKEDAQSDMDLHDLAERIIALSTDGKVLSMDNYDAIVGTEEAVNETNLSPVFAKANQQGWHDAYSGRPYDKNLVNMVFQTDEERKSYVAGYKEGAEDRRRDSLTEDASGGGTSSGGIASAIPGDGGFGNSIFMSRAQTTKPKKTKRK